MSAEPLKLITTCAGYDGLAARTISRSTACTHPTIVIGCYTSQNQVAIALGCEDGSVFLFASSTISPQTDRNRPPSIRVPSDVQMIAARKRAPLSAPHPHRAASPESVTRRPLSPSSLSISALSMQSNSGTHTPNPLAVPSRSRITQPGISRASIEASKVHVDVGDEQGKLRAILDSKGRRPVSAGSEESTEGRGSDRAGGPMSLARSVVDLAFGGIGIKARGTPGSDAAVPVSGNESDDEGVLSPTTSESRWASAGTIKVGIDLSPIKLELRGHSLPAHGGVWEAVTGLEVVGDQDMCISLQASGTLNLLSLADGYCLASVHADDLPRLNPPHAYKNIDSISGSWEWVNLSVTPYVESTIVMIAARLQPESSAIRVAHSRVTVYRIPEFDSEAIPAPNVALEKLGEWFLEAEAYSISFIAGCGGLTLAYLNTKGHVILAPLNVLPPPPEPEPEQTLNIEPNTPVPSIGPIPIPNPFSAFKPREPVNPVAKPRNQDGRMLAGTERDMGLCWKWLEMNEEDGSFTGMKVYGEGQGSEMIVLIWTKTNITVYAPELGRDELKKRCEIPADDLTRPYFLDCKTFTAIKRSGTETYALRKTDSNGDPASALKEEFYHYERISSTTFQARAQAVGVVSLLGQLCVVTAEESTTDSELTIRLQNLSQDKHRSSTVWKSLRLSSGIVETTAVLPVNADSIFAARSDGGLYRVRLSELATGSISQLAEGSLGSRVTKLWLVTEEYSKELYVVGASGDGGILCWNARSLQLIARWTIFISDLESVVGLSIEDDRLGRLKGCMMAVAADGTIAVIVLDGMSLSCIIPGSPAPLDRICIGGDNLLLFYSHGIARSWDMKTHEFWRSMQQIKGEELLDQGGWFEIPVGRWEAPLPVHALGTLRNNISSPDAGASLVMDIPSAVGLARDQATRGQLVQVLAAVVPCGVNLDIDTLCEEVFGVGGNGKVALGLINEQFGAGSVVVSDDAVDVWKVSPRYTAVRLLSIVSLLRSALGFEEHEQRVSEIISFYVGCLAEAVGPGLQPPSLGTLATFWVHSSDEIRQATRTIFESRLTQMTEAEVIKCVAFWKDYLPILQPLNNVHSPLAVRALTVCGVIAATKHSLLPTPYITDIAKSIALYLYDETQASTISPASRILSIELCSRGFQVWQHHVDAMEMLRALSGFAVAPLGAGKGGKEARTAVLQIAASSTPLFMATLSLDITQPKTVEHRKATMQLVSFIIRKKPLVLYPNLPRLVEAVVKSLDPNSSGRDAIVDAATEILAEVVRIYPSVDFHMATQKLAVGTPEGAVILYDLKTATRLYVLEGHSRRLTVLSFSPDGRRLATASLEESVVMVWKVGTSFSTWFTPGAPPRQGHGHGTSEPYKRLDFNVGDEAHMTIAATLEWVTFGWPTDRTARLSIRDSVLTFAC